MNRATILMVAIAAVSLSASPSVRMSTPPACDPDNGGITLPKGFCAVVVADQVGRARHLAVAANGDIFVALEDGRGAAAKGGVLALRDPSGAGKAGVGEPAGTGAGPGIALSNGEPAVGTAPKVHQVGV